MKMTLVSIVWIVFKITKMMNLMTENSRIRNSMTRILMTDIIERKMMMIEEDDTDDNIRRRKRMMMIMIVVMNFKTNKVRNQSLRNQDLFGRVPSVPSKILSNMSILSLLLLLFLLILFLFWSILQLLLLLCCMMYQDKLL